MKIVKSLILMLVLAGATYAGEILQPAAAPQPASITRPTTSGKAADLIVGLIQNLLFLR